MKYIFLCILNSLLMATGQVLFKMGAKGKSMGSLTEILCVMINPVTILALVIYAAATVFWLYILTKVPLSYAYPIQALAFPIVVLISIILFKEVVPLSRWIGILIICVGVYIVAMK